MITIKIWWLVGWLFCAFTWGFVIDSIIWYRRNKKHHKKMNNIINSIKGELK